MAAVQAQRTLVKSPPELWAELSDLECLARHLGEFGEIRITRLEAEQTVAWEGELACGTVKLEASGWGTRVTLTAEVPEAEAAEPEPEPEPVFVPEPEPEPEAEPVAVVVSEPVLLEIGAKPKLFARMRRWFAGPEIEFAPPEPEPVVVIPEPEPELPVPEPEPELPVPEPEPVAVSASGPDPLAVLTAVLDHLGAAHHRPFSRG